MATFEYQLARLTQAEYNTRHLAKMRATTDPARAHGGRRYQLSRADVDAIVGRYLAGESCTRLAAAYLVGPDAIRYHLIKRGIPRRPRGRTPENC